MRLDKYLSKALNLTRSQVKQELKGNQVVVNEVIVKDGSIQIDETKDSVFYKGKLVIFEQYQYYMFHKPAGCVTANKDNMHKTIFDYMKNVDPDNFFAVGRLDKDTEGLLFITNDGEFDHSLTSPKKHVRKTYYVELDGSLTKEMINELENGVLLHGEDKPTKPAQISCIKDLPTEGNMIVEEANNSCHLTIIEGKFHQVKRMFQAIGLQVTYLKRISIGTVSLDTSLGKGEYRKMTRDEVESFKV